MSDDSFLQVIGVSKAFGGLQALRGVSLGIPKGSMVGLIGPNGSGKSTLFDIVTRFQDADEGAVVFQGERIEGMPPHSVAQRGLMRTFQLSEGGQRLTVLENLMAATQHQAEANLLAVVAGLPALRRRERENLERALGIVRLLGLEKLANEYVGNLSGGQRKLIDLGRVFMAQPAICLLDEPTAGVNPVLIGVILDALRRMNAEFGVTVFIVEHNMHVISEVCQRVFVLDAGEVIAEGSPAEVQRDERVLDVYLGKHRAA